MKSYIMRGWKLAWGHVGIILMLFLYQFAWAFLLYRMIDQIAAPLLRRFPNPALPGQHGQAFIVEAQFQLLKTDLLVPYLWSFGALLALRLLLTPIFNAGLLYSLHQQANGRGGTSFRQGIRKTWKPIALLYALQALLTAIPAWWLLPKWLGMLLKGGSIDAWLSSVLPGALLWLLWGMLLQLLFLAMQLGAASGEGVFPCLWRSVKRFVPYAAVSLIMWGIAALLGLAFNSLSMLWAGLFALIVHQGYPLVQTLLKVWTIAAQLSTLEGDSRH